MDWTLELTASPVASGRGEVQCKYGSICESSTSLKSESIKKHVDHCVVQERS